MSFANRGQQEELQWTQIYWFDTNELPVEDEEAILSSELRIYKEAATDKVGGSGLFMMKVFRLVEGSTTNKQLLDSRTLRYSEEGKFLRCHCFLADLYCFRGFYHFFL